MNSTVEDQRNSLSSLEAPEEVLKLDSDSQHDASGSTVHLQEDETTDRDDEEGDFSHSDSYGDEQEEQEDVRLPIEVDLFHLAQKSHKLRFGHKHQMLILVSLYGQANNRESMTQQNHTLTILQGVLGGTMEEPFLLVDASDPTHHLQRDALLEISGCGPNYPQFFLVQRRREPKGRTIHDLYEEVEFFGDYNDLFEANERGTLRSSFLSKKPLARKAFVKDHDDIIPEGDDGEGDSENEREEQTDEPDLQVDAEGSNDSGKGEDAGPVEHPDEANVETEEPVEEVNTQQEIVEIPSGPVEEVNTQQEEIVKIPSGQEETEEHPDEAESEIPTAASEDDDTNYVLHDEQEKIEDTIQPQSDSDNKEQPDVVTTEVELPEEREEAILPVEPEETSSELKPEESLAAQPETQPVTETQPEPEPQPEFIEEPPKPKPRNSIKKKTKKPLKENALCQLPDWVETWMFLPSNPVVGMTQSISRVTHADKSTETKTEATLILRNGERHTQSHTETTIAE